MKIKNKNSGYTIIVTLMIIGFLIVLTTGTLNLVLRELNDNRGEGNYLKAYGGAEGAMELALLQIKENGYGVYNKIDLGKNNDSKILRKDPEAKREILIGYDLNSKTQNYNGTLDSFEQVVIPLFYIDSSLEKKVKNIKLDYSGSNSIGWNIVSQYGDGIGGNSKIESTTKGYGRTKDGSFLPDISINGDDGFLDKYNKNYLILINLDETSRLEFELKSLNPSEYFTKPVSKIISSARIGNYKQNLETVLDNTEFLSILKYSVFSN